MSMKTIFLAFTMKNSSVAEFFVELANQLSRTHKVIIFTHAVENHSLVLNESIEVRRWPSPRPTRIADMIFLQKMIKEYKPQIMISNFAAVNLFLTIGFIFRIPQRIAWYHTLYDQIEKNFFLKFRKKIVYSLATHIIANSNASKNDLIKNFGVRTSKIFVIYNALQQIERENQGNPNKVVYAGRLDAVKGVSTLISAMSIVIPKYPSLKLHIIGDENSGNEANKLKILVKELKLEENIFFRGNKSRNEVLKEFSSAWFSVVPSLVEAFGYVVIESFSVKTPVIGSNTSGIAEIIRDDRDGFLFEVNNHIDLAKKINLLLGDPKLRDQFSENCYDRFLESFEIKGVVNKFCTIFRL